jgi:O-antigen/teichoic acid export membrane protein
MSGTIEALIAAAVVQGVLQVGMMLVYLNLRFPGFMWCFDWPLLRAQAIYALPLGASGVLWKLQDDVHHGFVSNAFGPAGYAVYAVGVLELPLIGMLRESVGSVVLPRINELEAQNEAHKIIQLVGVAARKLALAYWPIYGVLMVMGREVITLLFTTQYLASWPVFALALTLVPFSVVVLDPVTRAHNQRFYILRMRILIFAVLVGVLWAFSAKLGLTGVIAVVVAANLCSWAMAVHRMARMLHMRLSDLHYFSGLERIALAAAVAAGVTAVVRSMALPASPFITLAICVPVYGAVYAGLITITGVLKSSELSGLGGEVIRAVWSRRRKPSAGRA